MSSGVNSCCDAIDLFFRRAICPPSPRPIDWRDMFEARFQTFDDPLPTPTGPRVQALRAELARVGLSGLVLPRADRHQNEYVPASEERLAWLSGFTGSAGSLIVQSGLLPHRSGLNGSSAVRRAYLCQFSPRPVVDERGRPIQMAVPLLRNGQMVQEIENSVDNSES